MCIIPNKASQEIVTIILFDIGAVCSNTLVLWTATERKVGSQERFEMKEMCLLYRKLTSIIGTFLSFLFLLY